MRRAAPRPVATALERLTADIVPATLIAEVLRVWPEAAGEAFAAACTPTSAGKGELRVSCQSAVWAQELDLFSERVLERLNDLLDGERVERMRVKTGAAPSRPLILYAFAALSAHSKRRIRAPGLLFL